MVVGTSLLLIALCGQAPPAVAAAAAPAAPAPPKWTGTVGLGLIYLSGNSKALTLNGNAVAEYKTEHWIYGLKALAIYGTSRPASAEPGTGSEVNALAASLQLRIDRRITQAVSIYLLGGTETDHVKSIEYRGYGESGVSYIWLDRKEGELSKIFLRTDLAFRYTHESRFQYYPSGMSLPADDLYAPRVGLAFRYNLSKEVGFLQDAEVLPNVTNGRVLINTLSKLTTRLFHSFSLAVGFTIAYDSSPPPGKKDTDTALNLSLEYTL